jgi:hypothetical protein
MGGERGDEAFNLIPSSFDSQKHVDPAFLLRFVLMEM